MTVSPPERDEQFPEVSERAHAGGCPTLQFDRFSGLYIAVGLFIVYSSGCPRPLGNVNNARIIAASAAITGIIALGATVSLVVGAFDVSIAANMSFAITLVGWLQSSTA